VFELAAKRLALLIGALELTVMPKAPVAVHWGDCGGGAPSVTLVGHDLNGTPGALIIL
jgi:hypothetical protein